MNTRHYNAQMAGRDSVQLYTYIFFNKRREESVGICMQCCKNGIVCDPAIVVLFAIRLYGFQNLDWRVMLCLQRIMKYIELHDRDCVELTDEYRRLCIWWEWINNEKYKKESRITYI